MEIFEIHITGDEKIIEVAQQLGIKTIVIDLAKPDKSYFRTEYMTSHACQFKDYEECKSWVDDLVAKLTTAGVNIVRVKIECPYYQHYRDQSLYFEVHYEGDFFPMSQNRGKDYYLCTAREYDKSKYDDLWQVHGSTTPPQHWTMELCLYDTNIEEDKDWFDLYEQ